MNVTEDSFSDGGRFLSPQAALEHARGLTAAGADVIELGPASSNPDAAPVPADTQIARIAPVLDGLAGQAPSISIDATDPEVIRYSLAAGASMLNDVRGFPNERLYPELAESDASLVVMHSLLGRDRATRGAATVGEVLDSIDRFFDQRLATLVRAGVSEERLIVDPGMGFFLASDPRPSIAVLQRIPELRARFGRPVFVSVSRKSFLRAVSGSHVDAIAPATLAAELYAARAGADYIRTHDVVALRDGIAVERALGNED